MTNAIDNMNVPVLTHSGPVARVVASQATPRQVLDLVRSRLAGLH